MLYIFTSNYVITHYHYWLFRPLLCRWAFQKRFQTLLCSWHPCLNLCTLNIIPPSSFWSPPTFFSSVYPVLFLAHLSFSIPLRWPAQDHFIISIFSRVSSTPALFFLLSTCFLSSLLAIQNIDIYICLHATNSLSPAWYIIIISFYYYFMISLKWSTFISLQSYFLAIYI